jgi:hypothetical protein
VSPDLIRYRINPGYEDSSIDKKDDEFFRYRVRTISKDGPSLMYTMNGDNTSDHIHRSGGTV